MPIGNSTKKKNHSHNFISKFDQMFVGAIKLDGEVIIWKILLCAIEKVSWARLWILTQITLLSKSL